MKYNRLNNTELEISPITLGTWVFGGHFWGGAERDECIAAVHCAIEHGINCIDTAPIYSNGESERIVGEGIKGQREKIVIATKCGLISKGGKILPNLTRGSILNEVDQSLQRLQTDYIDIYQCHWPDPNTPIEETMEALNYLKKQGKIKHIGLSNYEADLFGQVCKHAEIVTSQNQYSLLDRRIEKELIPFLKEKKIGVLAYGPLAGGILTGKYREAPRFKGGDARNFLYKYYEGSNFLKTKALIERLNTLGHPPNQLAINWVRQQRGVATVLVGCRNPKQVQENMKAIEWDLKKDELSAIADILQEKVHG